MTEPIPDDASRRRTWLIAGVLSLVVVLVGVGIAFAVLALRAGSAKSTAPGSSVQATPLPSSTLPSSTAGTTTTPASSNTSDSAGSSTTTTPPPGQIVRSARIAFRLGGNIWVAGEDGLGRKQVVSTAAGAFSLSPDGRTIVVMANSSSSGSGGGAVLVDVDTGAQSAIPLALDLPTWSPDSSWLAYTASASVSGSTHAHAIRRRNRDGSGDALVLSGAAGPSISPDGKFVAYSSHLQGSSSATGPVSAYDLNLRTTVSLKATKGASSYAFASGGALYFSIGGTNGWLGMENKSFSKDTAAGTRLATLPSPDLAPAPQLFPSPDGSKVMFAMLGDGNRSHVFVADAAAKKITPMQPRLDIDAAPIAWMLDGSGVLDVEGNFDTGKTDLYQYRPDGTHRALVVTGAGL